MSTSTETMKEGILRFMYMYGMGKVEDVLYIIHSYVDSEVRHIASVTIVC